MPELSDFLDSVNEVEVFLRALNDLLPGTVTDDLLTYLANLRHNPTGAKFLRNALAKSQRVE